MMSDLNKNFEDRYNKLNERQRQAVDRIDGPVLVVAGPGTGKTELLSMRVANILKKTDINPESILCLTFTESGREAMRKRLTTLLGTRADQVSVFTFHGFCGYLKNRYGMHFWKGSGSEVAGELTEYSVLENIFKKLPHNNPLKSYHSEEGYSFLRDTKTRIKDLKEAGVLPEEFFTQIKAIEKEYKLINNKLTEFINDRVSKSSKGSYELFLNFLNADKDIKILKPELVPQLEKYINGDDLSGWKTKFTELVEGERYLKGTKNIDKMYALQKIYTEYVEEMEKEKYIDYADIILNTLQELKRNETLRNEIQEFFQYILVDEFQDTNNSQFEILKQITSHSIHEGRPNIMIVGDDDQAVYRFQGGNANNLLEFKEYYKEVLTVVLEDNYRSHQSILDLGKSVIEHSEDRLTKKIKNFNKDLVSFKTSKEKLNNTPKVLKFETSEQEFEYICKDIQKKLKEGLPGHEIAIIGKKHKQLEEIAVYLNKYGIPYSYERETTLLENPQIEQIITLLKCANSHHSTFSNIENYIPQILTFPFWNIERSEILNLGLKIRKDKTLWYEEISNSQNPKISKVAKFLDQLITDSTTVPLYYLIDRIIQETNFKDYYFSNVSRYVIFINDLKTLYDTIKNYKRKNILYARDIETVIENINLYKINLRNEEDTDKTGKISLLTSHKSKGLEFESVFLFGTNKKYWGTRGKTPSLNFIYGLPYTRYKEEESDFIRSLFVAITRGKSDLNITYTENLVHYMPEGEEITVKNDKVKEEKVLHLTDFYDLNTFSSTEKEILKSYTTDYRISPTHLNNFLDFTNCGPKKFIQENLLRFPIPPNENSMFGTLMHNTLEIAGKYKLQNKKDMTLKSLLEIFKTRLEREILTEVEFKKMLAKGQDILTDYYPHIKEFGKGDVQDRFEISMTHENITIDKARLTGNIDRIQVNNKDREVIIYDFKTGNRTFDDWDVDEIYKIKLYKYRNQLLFYKILLENHKEYKDYKIKLGVVDFIEIKDKKHRQLFLAYEKQEIDRMKKLISSVYFKINNLDFPDTDHYPENIKGVLQFEEDLLSGKI